MDTAPILLFVYNRPAHTRQALEALSRNTLAAASDVFVYSDAARSEADCAAVEEVRHIVREAKGFRQVHVTEREQNWGLARNIIDGVTTMVNRYGRGIVLEDDDVPSVSFFQFCKEMLDKYEYDTRISMIAGFNPEEITQDMPYDYFFTTTFSIWGWASWKRVVDQWDEFYSFLDDSFNMQQLEQLIKERKFRSDFIYMCQRHREQQKAFYETIFHASILFNSGLSIVPTRNMINNLGATADSTHFAGSVHTLPKGYRRIFTMKRYEVDFPLRHPRYVIENVAYKEKVYRIMGWDHPWIKIGRSFEELFLNLKYGNFSIITKAVKNRINKWLKRNKHH